MCVALSPDRVGMSCRLADVLSFPLATMLTCLFLSLSIPLFFASDSPSFPVSVLLQIVSL